MNVVLAVSGGVDSVALLDAVVSKRLTELGTYLPHVTTVIVAHFDHGVRADSDKDSKLVGGLAKKYGVLFECHRAELGPDTSELTAREQRYGFLRQVCKKYNAALVTAHHQDDLIETMLINLIRGTGWRGLVSMNHIPGDPFKNPGARVLRPLLGTSKQQLLSYAEKYKLSWREDSTNTDQAYLRNYVRLTLLPRMTQKDPALLEKLLQINKATAGLKDDIATELQKLLPGLSHLSTEHKISRYLLIMCPPSAALEILYTVLVTLDPDWHPNTAQLKRLLHFIKTAGEHKQMEVSGGLIVEIKQGSVQFKKV